MRPRRAPANSLTEVAQLAGSVALAELGLVAVDSPGGLLGPSNTLTPGGLAIGMALAVAAAAVAVARARGQAGAGFVVPLLYAMSIGVFLPAVPADPVLAGLVVGWLLYRLLRELIPARPVRLTVPVAELDERRDLWLARHGAAVRHLSSMAVFLTVLAAGYGVGDRLPAFVVCLSIHGLALAWSLRLLGAAWRAGARWPAVTAALVAAAVATAFQPPLCLALLACAQLPVLVAAVRRAPVTEELVGFFLELPAALVAASFLLLIALGTLLLSFPAAASSGQPLRPVDALFTATSAACVTGLVVVDTGTVLSTFGQMVVLLLIQAGGLSIMVLSTFAAMLLGQRLGIRGELALGEVLDQDSSRSALRLVRFVVVATAGIETLGAAALAAGRVADGTAPAASLWWGLFHSVSAFCNAGFALQADSLAAAVQRPWILLVVATLITAGGLGFPVLLAVWSRATRRGLRPFDLHSRIVLWSSMTLVAAGAVWFGVVEAGRALAGLAPQDLAVNALFQSITLRTAGFNSVDLAAMSPATLMVMMVLMFVGASPGGTGGGIKTTTAAVLLGAVPAILRRRQRVVLGRRTVSLETVFRSAAIAVIAVMVVVAGSVALLASQPLPFEVVLFEAVSAFGTVGLSLGATPQLDSLGRVVVVLLMFGGRIGPLTLALLLARGRPSKVRYPETRIMVG